MVIGLDKFKSWFQNYHDSYIIIGGTACDAVLDDAGFTPRATKDIDMQEFANEIKDSLPSKQMLHDAGYEGLEPEILYWNLISIFQLEIK